MNLKNYFNKIIFILGNKKKVFLILILLFFLLSFFETLSLALIAPYLTILLNNSDDSLNDSIIFNLLDKIHIHENIIFSFGIFIIIVFTCKLIVSVSNIFIVNTIGWKEIIRLRLKLLTSFSYMNYDQYIKKNSSEYINLII